MKSIIYRLKKGIRKGVLLTLVAILSLSTIPTPTYAAEDKYACDALYYSGNDVLFYNPCEDSCGAANQSGTLKGVDNVEKVWNFFASKGLTPEATAGIMGNFSQESYFDPAIKQGEILDAIPIEGDGTTGYGLAQWTYKSRQAGLFTRMKAVGLDKYLGQGWGAREKNREIPPDDIDKLLEVELTYAWEGDSTKVSDLKDKLNELTTVEGNNGTTVYFHNTYENSADDATQIQERVDDAKAILAKFGGGSTSGGGACAGNGQLGGVKTLEDAIPWALRFVSDTKAEYEGTHINPSGTEMNEGDNPKYVYNFGHGSGSYCWNAADCGQCVALSGWFVHKQTTSEFLFENGGYIVDNYKNRGLPTGTEPRPFSVFSVKSGGAGHTGVVLGVLENGEVITAEANWGSGGQVVVWQGNIQSRYAGNELTFAYFDDTLANEAKAVMDGQSGGSDTKKSTNPSRPINPGMF